MLEFNSEWVAGQCGACPRLVFLQGGFEEESKAGRLWLITHIIEKSGRLIQATGAVERWRESTQLPH